MISESHSIHPHLTKNHNFNPKTGTAKQCYGNWLILFSLSTDNVRYSHFSFYLLELPCFFFSYVLHSYHFLNFAVFEIWASIFYMSNSHRLAMLPATPRLLPSFLVIYLSVLSLPPYFELLIYNIYDLYITLCKANFFFLGFNATS